MPVSITGSALPTKVTVVSGLAQTPMAFTALSYTSFQSELANAGKDSTSRNSSSQQGGKPPAGDGGDVDQGKGSDSPQPSSSLQVSGSTTTLTANRGDLSAQDAMGGGDNTYRHGSNASESTTPSTAFGEVGDLSSAPDVPKHFNIAQGLADSAAEPGAFALKQPNPALPSNGTLDEEPSTAIPANSGSGVVGAQHSEQIGALPQGAITPSIQDISNAGASATLAFAKTAEGTPNAGAVSKVPLKVTAPELGSAPTPSTSRVAQGVSTHGARTINHSTQKSQAGSFQAMLAAARTADAGSPLARVQASAGAVSDENSSTALLGHQTTEGHQNADSANDHSAVLASSASKASSGSAAESGVKYAPPSLGTNESVACAAVRSNESIDISDRTSASQLQTPAQGSLDHGAAQGNETIITAPLTQENLSMQDVSSAGANFDRRSSAVPTSSTITTDAARSSAPAIEQTVPEQPIVPQMVADTQASGPSAASLNQLNPALPFRLTFDRDPSAFVPPSSKVDAAESTQSHGGFIPVTADMAAPIPQHAADSGTGVVLPDGKAQGTAFATGISKHPSPSNSQQPGAGATSEKANTVIDAPTHSAQSNNQTAQNSQAGPSQTVTVTATPVSAGMSQAQSQASVIASSDLNTSSIQTVHLAPSGSVDTPHASSSPEVPGSIHSETGESIAVTGINTARLVQAMNGTEMRVGLRSTEFGDISIRTSVSQQQMLAQISLDHSDLSSALSAHVSSAQTKLGQESGLQTVIEIHNQGSTLSGGSEHSSQGEQRAFASSARHESDANHVDIEKGSNPGMLVTTGNGHSLDIQA
jgi:hypothetical protein